MSSNKCFICNIPLKEEDVYRDQAHRPMCEDCLYEQLGEYWEDYYIDDIISDIKEKFNGDYRKWKVWFKANHTICDGFHDIEWWARNDEITEIDGLFYCESCLEELDEESEFDVGRSLMNYLMQLKLRYLWSKDVDIKEVEG